MSFLVRKGQIRRLEGSSLPVGILGGVVGGCHQVPLYEKDVLVLCSDGALTAGEDWMEGTKLIDIRPWNQRNWQKLWQRRQQLATQGTPMM